MDSSVRRFWVGMTLVVGLAVWTGGPRVVARQFALPREAGKALDQQWPTWSLAQVAPTASACAADASPAVVLDIDSDGRDDVAAIVRTPDGVRLVALMNRQRSYLLHDIDQLGDDTAGGYLVVTPRGKAFANPRTGQNSYMQNATITILRCGQSTADLYQWRGFRFEKITVPHSTAAPPPA